MSRNEIKQRNWAGIVFVVLGLVFLLRNIHLLPLPPVFFSWKALLIVIGVVGIALGRKEGFIPLIIGALFIFIYDILGLYYFSFKDLWPIAFILVGLALIMRHRRIASNPSNDDSFLDEMALFSGVEKQVASDRFQGGKVTALFGGMDLDLRQAQLSNQENVIDLFTMFGGSDFKVPADWTVNVSQLTVVFGGFEDKRLIDKSKTDPNKVLTIRGLIMFGGGEIKNT